MKYYHLAKKTDLDEIKKYGLTIGPPAESADDTRIYIFLYNEAGRSKYEILMPDNIVLGVEDSDLDSSLIDYYQDHCFYKKEYTFIFD